MIHIIELILDRRKLSETHRKFVEKGKRSGLEWVCLYIYILEMEKNLWDIKAQKSSEHLPSQSAGDISGNEKYTQSKEMDHRQQVSRTIHTVYYDSA